MMIADFVMLAVMFFVGFILGIDVERNRKDM